MITLLHDLTVGTWKSKERHNDEDCQKYQKPPSRGQISTKVIPRMVERKRFGGVTPECFIWKRKRITLIVIIIPTLNTILLTRPSVVCPKERRRILNKFRSRRYHRHHCRGCLREFITMMMIMMMIIPKPSNQVWQLESSRIPLRATPPKNF